MMMGKTIVHTLSWNLFSETKRAVDSLYELNDKKHFHHILVDLGFPLIEGDKIPSDLNEAKYFNTERLKELADFHGSEYLKIDNVGVSQNWTAVAHHAGIGEEDVLICCDPDEIVYPDANNWVNALATVIREGGGRYGVSILMMPHQIKAFNKSNSHKKEVAGIKIIEVNGNAMWNCCAIDGLLIQREGGIPYPESHPIYGHLEGMMISAMNKYNQKWCALPDYISDHTDNVPLLREYKDVIIFKLKEMGRQITFDEFLGMKKEGKI